MALKRGTPQPEFENSGRDSKILRALRDDAARPGVEHQLAILFSDIVGSTRYFEQHGDEDGLRMLKRHHELLRQVVEAHAGRVVKTIGDGLMAVFGSARDALEASREMQVTMRDNSIGALPADRIRIRIGIHYGRVLVDSKGDAFGDVVNVAARIQARAEPDQILIGDALRERLEDDRTLRSVGVYQLKGKTSRLEVFELPWQPKESGSGVSVRWVFLVGIVVAGCLAGIVFAELHRSAEPELPQVVNGPLTNLAPTPAEPVAPEPTTRKEPTPEGRLTLVTFPDAELWDGRRKLGKTPVFNLALPEGVHRLQLVGADHQKRALTVTVKRAKPVTLKLKLSDVPLAR